jgi:serine/threonine protein phosphatase 1
MHVQFVALRALLELARVSETDHVIFLGDYVDGGPESAQVLDFLSEFVRPPTVVALRN